MNPSTLGARYIYEIGDTLGDMLAWGDCPQIDFTGTKNICLYINRNDNEGYLHWRIDSRLVVRAEGLSKSGLVGESLMKLPISSQNSHYPQNHVDFKKRRQIDGVI